MQYGVDVGSTRLDDLDKRILVDVKERFTRSETVRVLDVGCGRGGLATALLEFGAEVVALDVADYSKEMVEIVEKIKSEDSAQLTFVYADIREFLKNNTNTFDMVVLQRVLHYLPYQDAIEVLTELRKYTQKLYLSVTGSTTAIANYYSDIDKPIGERFCILDTEGQKLFSITAPLCIYSREELLKLLADCGWQVEWSRVSDFGNVKVMVNSKELFQ